MISLTSTRHRWARVPLLGWTDRPLVPATRVVALSVQASAEAASTRERRDTIDSAQRGRPYRQFSTSDLGTMGRRYADAGDTQGAAMVLEELAQRNSSGARRLRDRLLHRPETPPRAAVGEVG